MSNLVVFLQELKQNARKHGVSFYPPLPTAAIQDWGRIVRSEFNMDIPDEIPTFLNFTDGLHTQRGVLFGADAFLSQNHDQWFCESHLENDEDGMEIIFTPVENPPKAEYAWLGTYGSMDMYIFDFESRQYRATSLGFPDEIYFSAPTFEELLSYITRPRE